MRCKGDGGGHHNMDVISMNSHVCVHKVCLLCIRSMFLLSSTIHRGDRDKKKRQNTVQKNVTSNNLNDKNNRVRYIHCLQQAAKHVPATT